MEWLKETVGRAPALGVDVVAELDGLVDVEQRQLGVFGSSSSWRAMVSRGSVRTVLMSSRRHRPVAEHLRETADPLVGVGLHRAEQRLLDPRPGRGDLLENVRGRQLATRGGERRLDLADVVAGEPGRPTRSTVTCARWPRASPGANITVVAGRILWSANRLTSV